MAQITLTRADVLKLHEFCKKNKTKWFVAKDQGAYIGASVGSKPAQQCLWYFAGCNPQNKKTPDDFSWYDRARDLFGGDDFGEHLPMAWLDKVAENPRIKSMKVKVSARSITADFALEAAK